MDRTKVLELFQILADIVAAPGTWRHKRDFIKTLAMDEDKADLAEFIEWFSDDD